MTKKTLWSPNKKKETNLTKFQKKLPKKLKIINYDTLHKWSINYKEQFWSTIWNFTKIKGNKKKPILENEKDFIDSKFFKNSELNFTENIIQKKSKKDAIVFYSEQGNNRRINWEELFITTNKISTYLTNLNIKKGDRIVGILPNIPETVIAFLATAKIGAVWSSCSPDFGPTAILDRFKQIKPKVLFICDEYFYNDKRINTLKNIKLLLKDLKSIKKIIIISYFGTKKKFKVNFPYNSWNTILENNNKILKYKKFNFNIPLYILFSSGTTGVPKCIVHGAGGSLIQHKKEHQLHCNINENDKIFYFTTCGWMMWNWLISCLASKASILLYDGSPFFPYKDYLFEIIAKEKITFFGTGAKYLDYLKQNKINIKKKYNLSFLKTISSTGSPLVNETFKYVYKYIKKDIHLASISGGTDIVSCFVLGNPNQSVFPGEIQSKGLGMDVDVFDDFGNSVKKQKGELVCKSSFPSKPIYFWKDKNNLKYFKNYFSKYKNIWHHGDFAELTENNGFVIYGRSDATLNSKGIRIGTAEIYRVVENINEVSECLATEYNKKNDSIVILFIKLKEKINFNKNLEKKIKNKIKTLLSPKHIPEKIIQIKDIPKTKSGKIVELTIKKIINRDKIQNTNTLINPECLKEYIKIAGLLNKE